MDDRELLELAKSLGMSEEEYEAIVREVRKLVPPEKWETPYYDSLMKQFMDVKALAQTSSMLRRQND